MAGETRVRHSALGALFAQQIDEVLASAAPVPENCTRTGQDMGVCLCVRVTVALAMNRKLGWIE